MRAATPGRWPQPSPDCFAYTQKRMHRPKLPAAATTQGSAAEEQTQSGQRDPRGRPPVVPTRRTPQLGVQDTREPRAVPTKTRHSARAAERLGQRPPDSGPRPRPDCFAYTCYKGSNPRTVASGPARIALLTNAVRAATPEQWPAAPSGLQLSLPETEKRHPGSPAAGPATPRTSPSCRKEEQGGAAQRPRGRRPRARRKPGQGTPQATGKVGPYGSGPPRTEKPTQPGRLSAPGTHGSPAAAGQPTQPGEQNSRASKPARPEGETAT